MEKKLLEMLRSDQKTEEGKLRSQAAVKKIVSLLLSENETNFNLSAFDCEEAHLWNIAVEIDNLLQRKELKPQQYEKFFKLFETQLRPVLKIRLLFTAALSIEDKNFRSQCKTLLEQQDYSCATLDFLKEAIEFSESVDFFPELALRCFEALGSDTPYLAFTVQEGLSYGSCPDHPAIQKILQKTVNECDDYSASHLLRWFEKVYLKLSPHHLRLDIKLLLKASRDIYKLYKSGKNKDITFRIIGGFQELLLKGLLRWNEKRIENGIYSYGQEKPIFSPGMSVRFLRTVVNKHNENYGVISDALNVMVRITHVKPNYAPQILTLLRHISGKFDNEVLRTSLQVANMLVSQPHFNLDKRNNLTGYSDDWFSKPKFKPGEQQTIQNYCDFIESKLPKHTDNIHPLSVNWLLNFCLKLKKFNCFALQGERMMKTFAERLRLSGGDAVSSYWEFVNKNPRLEYIMVGSLKLDTVNEQYQFMRWSMLLYNRNTSLFTTDMKKRLTDIIAQNKLSLTQLKELSESHLGKQPTICRMLAENETLASFLEDLQLLS